MKKLICLSLISLVCGFLSVHASIQADDTKPFVGKWEYWKGNSQIQLEIDLYNTCLLYTSPSPRDISGSRMPSSA